MRKICLMLIFLGISLITKDSFGQQRPVYSQYLFNALAINPAFAGSQEMFSATLLYRNQWVNFPGAPTIETLSVNSAVVKGKVGLGMLLSHDNVGVHGNTGLFFSYAYRIKGENGTLAMGIQAGFNLLKSDFSELNLSSPADPNLSGIFKKFNPNFGAGVFYYTRRLFAGFSSPYLVNNKVFRGEDFLTQAKERRNYYIFLGRLFTVSDVLDVRPSTLVRLQEQAPLGVDLNMQFIVQRLISLGVSYRSGDAMIYSFELQINDNFRIGYAYEWTLSSIGQYARGSHELMLNYKIGIPGLIKGIECPTYL